MLNQLSRPGQQRPPELRWLIAADMPAILEIAAAGFDYPWLEKDFQQALQISSVIGLVAERENRIVGYVIYEICHDGIALLNLAVAKHARGTGVGRALVAKLVSKLPNDGHGALTAIVNERDLAAQLWLKALGFEATHVLHGHFDDRPDDPADDGYSFRYLIGEAVGSALG
jgi:ribosomal-protein-alanine N-acetyltransferase